MVVRASQTAICITMNTDKKLTRSSTDKQVGGVCGGLARYFDIDTTIVTRVGFIATTLFTGGAAALAYVAMLVVMPSDKKTDEPVHYDPLRRLSRRAARRRFRRAGHRDSRTGPPSARWDRSDRTRSS